MCEREGKVPKRPRPEMKKPARIRGCERERGRHRRSEGSGWADGSKHDRSKFKKNKPGGGGGATRAGWLLQEARLRGGARRGQAGGRGHKSGWLAPPTPPVPLHPWPLHAAMDCLAASTTASTVMPNCGG